MSALTKGQKAYLAQLAERAFNLASARLRGEGGEARLAQYANAIMAPDRETALELLLLSGTKPARDVWRHEQVANACGKAGLTCCSQLNYKTVEGHFLDLINRPAAAFNAHVRSASEELRQARFNVDKACRDNGYEIGYGRSLCVRIHKVNFDEADAGVLRMVMFTVINHGKAKKAKLSSNIKKRQEELPV